MADRETTDGERDPEPHRPDTRDGAAYILQGDRVVPTDRARGPWFREQQHGAAVLGLLGHVLERVAHAQPMRFTRITADLSRAVPMRPLTVAARPLRDGRRVQSLEATILDDGAVLARAVATRIRVEPGLVPRALLPPLPDADVAPAFEGDAITYDMGYESFHDCLEIRGLERGQVVDDRTWYRLASELVQGTAPSPFVRMAATADMISSAGWQLGPGWISINPEVTLQVEREPLGEWLCNTSTVRFTDDGVGVTQGVMFDTGRRVGCSSKSLLNDPR